MIGTGHQSTGFTHSVRRLLDTGLGILQNRIELFAVEVREEKTHIVELFLWLSLALFLGMMAVVVLTATIILLFNEEKRVYVAGAFCLLYFAGAVWGFLGLRARLKESGLPFAETINEVKKDREWLQPK